MHILQKIAWHNSGLYSLVCLAFNAFHQCALPNETASAPVLRIIIACFFLLTGFSSLTPVPDLQTVICEAKLSSLSTCLAHCAQCMNTVHLRSLSHCLFFLEFVKVRFYSAQWTMHHYTQVQSAFCVCLDKAQNAQCKENGTPCTLYRGAEHSALWIVATKKRGAKQNAKLVVHQEQSCRAQCKGNSMHQEQSCIVQCKVNNKHQ